MSEPLIIAAPAERGSDTIADKSVRATWAISGGLHLTQTTIQETPFAVVRDETQGAAIASGTLLLICMPLRAASEAPLELLAQSEAYSRNSQPAYRKNYQ